MARRSYSKACALYPVRHPAQQGGKSQESGHACLELCSKTAQGNLGHTSRPPVCLFEQLGLLLRPGYCYEMRPNCLAQGTPAMSRWLILSSIPLLANSLEGQNKTKQKNQEYTHTKGKQWAARLRGENGQASPAWRRRAAPRQDPAAGRRGCPVRPGRPLYRAAPLRVRTTAHGRALPASGSERRVLGLAVAPH